MSDASVRGLLRTAEQTDDPEAWTRAARACARAGLGPLAGRGLLAAAARGVDPGPALDALAPELSAFRQRTLGERFGLGRLWLAAWRADGAELAVVEDRRVVRRLALAAGPSSSAEAQVLATLTLDVTALCFDPAGESLVLGLGSIDGGKPELLRLDLATGKQTAIGRGHDWIRAVACDGERVVVAEKNRVRAYPLRGVDRQAKSLWSAKGQPALDPCGASVVAPDGEPRSLTPRGPEGAERPPLTASDEVPARRHATNQVVLHGQDVGEHWALAGGRRALLATGSSVDRPERRLWLLGAGEQLERGTPAGKLVRTIAPGSSGWLVALGYGEGGERSTELGLLDLRSGEARSFDLGARPRDLVWSPSGQTLAVATDQGTVVLLDGAPGASEAKPAQDDGWLELRSGRQFWSARQVGQTVELRHGRVGAAGSRRTITLGDEAAAAKDLARRLREKEREGYTRAEERVG